jgi:hypothetical protein
VSVTPLDLVFLQSITRENLNEFFTPETLLRLINIIESQLSENAILKIQIQELRDEINRLKGEQGKPKFENKKKEPPKSTDYSSEDERKNLQPKPNKGRGERNHKVKIDREEIVKVPREELPPDAVFKGYDEVIVQDIKIVTDNILFKVELWYSASQNKTYRALRPKGYQGEFGPHIRALIPTLKYGCNVSEPAIHTYLDYFGILISPSTISRFLTKDLDTFHKECDEIIKAGLSSTRYQHIDDTGARVNGVQYHTHILCNEFYTAFLTKPHKDRLTVLEILFCEHEMKFTFDSESFDLMKTFRVPNKTILYLQKNVFNQTLDAESLEPWLQSLPSDAKQIESLIRRIKEAGAISYYHNQKEWPAIEILMSDAAPQFAHIAFVHAQCWIHEGRHLKKLNPTMTINRELLEEFLKNFWDFYQELLKYKEHNTPEDARRLEQEFDRLFATKTGYDNLDERIQRIANNKQELLVVLENPEVPLHNNAAELGARVQVRKRDVSLHTITAEGTKAQDTFQTIVQTAKKLGVNPIAYFYDRFTQCNAIDRLAVLIHKMAGVPPPPAPIS